MSRKITKISNNIAALLFMVYINDLPELMKNVIKMFADDTKIIAKVGKDQNQKQFNKI